MSLYPYENELKRIAESLDKLVKIFTPQIIQEDLEVLEILHDKEVVLECVKATDNYKDYIRVVQRVYGNVNIDITEQEYNLLKRWLENGKINNN